MLTNDFPCAFMHILAMTIIFVAKYIYIPILARKFNDMDKTFIVIIRNVVIYLLLFLQKVSKFTISVKAYNLIFVCYSIKLVIYHITLFFCATYGIFFS